MMRWREGRECRDAATIAAVLLASFVAADVPAAFAGFASAGVPASVDAAAPPGIGAACDWSRSSDATKALGVAIAARDRTSFEDAIERGADWRCAGLPDTAVLCLAAAFDAERAVRRLVARGIAVDAPDLSGETALFAAASAGAARTTAALLELGGDPNRVVRSRRAPGWTPLFAAVVAGRIEIVRTLIAAGAAVKIVDDHGRSPLLYAALHGQVSVARLLLRRGAEPGRADDGGRTPLSVASALGYGPLIDALAGVAQPSNAGGASAAPAAPR